MLYSSRTLFPSCWDGWVEGVERGFQCWAGVCNTYFVLSLLYRLSTQSSPSWWRRTRSKEEQSRPCIRRCWVTLLAVAAAVHRNAGPSLHGWDIHLLRKQMFLSVKHGLEYNLNLCPSSHNALSLVPLEWYVCNCLGIINKEQELSISIWSQMNILLRAFHCLMIFNLLNIHSIFPPPRVSAGSGYSVPLQ